MDVRVGLSNEKKALIIDDYFRRQNYYPWIMYEDIGKDVVDCALNHTGTSNLWISTACALIEQESGGKKIFGADWGRIRDGRIPFAHMYTTEERVRKLTAFVKQGGQSNGIGLTQVTYKPYVLDMDNMGGGWNTRVQLIKGFNILNDLLNMWPYYEALEAYNDGSKWNNPLNPYELEFAAKHRAWKRRLR
jgi:hypothetical protein